jgi:hypothetical protein
MEASPENAVLAAKAAGVRHHRVAYAPDYPQTEKVSYVHDRLLAVLDMLSASSIPNPSRLMIPSLIQAKRRSRGI